MSLDEAQKAIEDRYRRYKTVESSMHERRTRSAFTIIVCCGDAFCIYFRLVSNLPDFNRALEYIVVCRQAHEAGNSDAEVLCKVRVENNEFKR